MRQKIGISLLALILSFSIHAADGLINVPSNHSVKETADRLENILKSKGMKIFGRVPHSEGAKSVGIELQPTELIIFGNPKVGSPLMKCAKSVAIDLPQKALVWQAKSGEVFITYNSPAYLKQRHNIEGCDPVLKKVEGALSGMTAAAAQ